MIDRSSPSPRSHSKMVKLLSFNIRSAIIYKSTLNSDHTTDSNPQRTNATETGTLCTGNVPMRLNRTSRLSQPYRTRGLRQTGGQCRGQQFTVIPPGSAPAGVVIGAINVQLTDLRGPLGLEQKRRCFIKQDANPTRAGSCRGPWGLASWELPRFRGLARALRFEMPLVILFVEGLSASSASRGCTCPLLYVIEDAYNKQDPGE